MNDEVQPPKITVVTVCYNAEKDIERTMLSVLNQTYQNLEYIIVDGASIDGTIDVVRSVVAKFPKRDIKITSEPDKGIYDAMNKGVKQATGEWINFMNAGDAFYDNNVIKSLNLYDVDENTGFVFGNTATKNGYLKLTPFVYKKCKYSSMGICHQSLFTRTRLAKEMGFDTKLKIASDYKMIREIYRRGYGFKSYNKPISVFDMYGVSSNNTLLQMKEEAIVCNSVNSWHYKINVLFYKIKYGIKNNILYRNDVKCF